jgi:hypothetical protein
MFFLYISSSDTAGTFVSMEKISLQYSYVVIVNIYMYEFLKLIFYVLPKLNPYSNYRPCYPQVYAGVSADLYNTYFCLVLISFLLIWMMISLLRQISSYLARLSYYTIASTGNRVLDS